MEHIFKEKFGFSISQKFDGPMEVLMQNGINYLEVRLVNGNDRELMRQYISTAKREKERLGYEIYTVHLPQLEDYDLSNPDEEIRLGAIQKQKEIVEMSLCLGNSVLVLHPDAGKIDEADYAKRHEALIKSLKDFAPWCKKKGLKIALENLTQISSVQTSAELLKIIAATGEDNIGICFDVNHLFKESHADFVKNAGKYILTMHVSDNDGIQERHSLPGEGVINWKEIFTLMDSIGYDSTMICECAQILGYDNFPEKARELKENWLRLHN